MTALASPRISALIAKLRRADPSGHYFSGDDIAGLVRELRSISADVKQLEDSLASARSYFVQVKRPPASQPIGTLVFVPTEVRS